MVKPKTWLDLYQIAVSNSPISNEWLVSNPSALEIKDGLGETVLHYCTVENQYEAVKNLIAVGANVNTQNEFGNTPIMEATQLGYKRIVNILYSSGADLKIKNLENHDIFEHLEEYEKFEMIEFLKKL